MKVSELIAKLQAMPQELEVYSYCDHANTAEKLGSPYIAYTDYLVHDLWDAWTSHKEEADERGYVERFVML